MRRIACAMTIAAGLAACSRGSVEPAGPAVATVQGRVLSAAGAPAPSVAVAVTCAGAAPVSATSGATGEYGAELTAPAAVLTAGDARVPCTFVAGDAAAPRVRTVAVVGFGASGLPHAVQRVDPAPRLGIAAPARPGSLIQALAGAAPFWRYA